MTTTAIDLNDTGCDDTLGVRIMVGDTVRVTSWGAPIRLADVGRTAQVRGVTRRRRLILADTDPVDPIARGGAVSPGCVAVARRDGTPGHEGNRTERDA